VVRNAPSTGQALQTLVLICVGLVRRSTWRSFIGSSQPYRYAYWSLRNLLKYGVNIPPAGPELPR
jgi:hypothetical protein